MQDRFLPDKAIDLLDEAGARLRLSTFPRSAGAARVRREDAGVRSQKEAAIEDQDFEKAASLRDEEKKLLGERLRLEKQWKSGDVSTTAVVDEGLIAEVLAAATGIPVFKLTEEESSRLIFMEKALHQRVIGQEEAISVLAKTIRRTRASASRTRSAPAARSSSPVRPVSVRRSWPRRSRSSSSTTRTRSSRST